MKKVYLILSSVLFFMLVLILVHFFMTKSNRPIIYGEPSEKISIYKHNDDFLAEESIISHLRESYDVEEESIATTSSVEIDTVIGYMNWAKWSNPQMKFRMVKGGEGSAKPKSNYSVDLYECEKYLKVLEESDYFSDKYINGWRENFETYAKYFKDNPKKSGPPDGFDYNFLFLSQEIDDKFLSEKSSSKYVRKYLKLNDKESVVIVDETPIRLTYRLSKYGEKYLIDDITKDEESIIGAIPEISVVLGFVNWYKKLRVQFHYAFVDVFPDRPNPYRVNLEECENYLNVLKNSGYISDKYIDEWREYFKRYADIYEREPRELGIFEGFDYDFIFRSMPRGFHYEFYATPMTVNSISDFIKISDNSSKVVINDGFVALEFTLSKYNNIYLIDKIEYR